MGGKLKNPEFFSQEKLKKAKLKEKAINLIEKKGIEVEKAFKTSFCSLSCLEHHPDSLILGQKAALNSLSEGFPDVFCFPIFLFFPFFLDTIYLPLSLRGYFCSRLCPHSVLTQPCQKAESLDISSLKGMTWSYSLINRQTSAYPHAWRREVGNRKSNCR
ncbi:hypothetical protein ES703_83156 [subsurface metagenome]